MDLELERWAHLQRPRRLVMVLASPRMTMHALHQAAANGTIFSTLELIPTPSQPDSATTMATTINQPTGTTA